jgi:hypothetical protein
MANMSFRYHKIFIVVRSVALLLFVYHSAGMQTAYGQTTEKFNNRLAKTCNSEIFYRQATDNYILYVQIYLESLNETHNPKIARQALQRHLNNEEDEIFAYRSERLKKLMAPSEEFAVKLAFLQSDITRLSSMVFLKNNIKTVESDADLSYAEANNPINRIRRELNAVCLELSADLIKNINH